jgi:hypothetical protein
MKWVRQQRVGFWCVWCFPTMSFALVFGSSVKRKYTLVWFGLVILLAAFVRNTDNAAESPWTKNSQTWLVELKSCLDAYNAVELEFVKIVCLIDLPRLQLQRRRPTLALKAQRIKWCRQHFTACYGSDQLCE